jgi:hypothetical protein
MKKLTRISLVIVTSLIVSALMYNCTTSSTMITGSWEKPGVEKQYDDILVSALTSTISSRSAIEQEIAQQLRNRGINASQSLDVLPPRFIEDQDERRKISGAIRSNGMDAILTVSLIEKDTDTRYVPGSRTYAPYPTYGFYGNFWGYYNYWYPRFDSPGYYTEKDVYYMETNLYDAETEDLIWSAQSETYNPVNLETFSENFAEEIVEELQAKKIIE